MCVCVSANLPYVAGLLCPAFPRARHATCARSAASRLVLPGLFMPISWRSQTYARQQCDERRPACSPCLRIGKECPGYRHEIKFVDEGQRLRRGRVVLEAAGPSGQSSGGPSGEPSGGNTSSASSPDSRVSRSSPGRHEAIPSRPSSPVSDLVATRQGFELLLRTPLTVMHCGRVLSILDNLPDPGAIAATLRNADVMPSYLSHIPRRLGFSASLDSAFDCVLTAAGYVAQSGGTEALQMRLLRKYGLALGHLREDIEDPEKAMSPEFLAAVSLLGTFEVRLTIAERLPPPHLFAYHASRSLINPHILPAVPQVISHERMDKSPKGYLQSRREPRSGEV